MSASPANAAQAQLQPQPGSASPRPHDSPPAAAAAEHVDELAEQSVRRSEYGPEFLKQMAGSGGGMLDGHRFSVIDGSDAETLVESYLGCVASTQSFVLAFIHVQQSDFTFVFRHYDHHRANSQLRSAHLQAHQRKHVVFALPAITSAGRKVVDYYMLMRGNKVGIVLL
jgi:hypothetical protein